MTVPIKLKQAFDAFDAINQQDPNVFVWEEKTWPREYFLALKLHEWVMRLKPDASEALLLASRCQHLGRWQIPRHQYPDDRIGYLTWRKELSRYHAEKAAAILLGLGYEAAMIEQVQGIVLKRGIKQDPDTQVMENALCLVFLQFQYETFRQEYPTKIVDVLRKSLRKMDTTGHRYALELQYTTEGRAVINEALAGM